MLARLSLESLERKISDSYQRDKPFTHQLPVFYRLVAEYHERRLLYDRENKK